MIEVYQRLRLRHSVMPLAHHLQIYVRQRHNFWLEDFWLTRLGPQTRIVYSSDKERRIVYLVQESLSRGQQLCGRVRTAASLDACKVRLRL